MADFDRAYERTLLNEGGYKLHNIPGDAGGLTYAGIARNMNPGWEGWAFIDRGETPPSDLVRKFYHQGYWLPLRAHDVTDQRVAETLYDFAVNTSAPRNPKVAVVLAQIVVGTTPDGVVGPKTLEALNAMPPRLFMAEYALAKIARYCEIVDRRPSDIKFLKGWCRRALKEAR